MDTVVARLGRVHAVWAMLTFYLALSAVAVFANKPAYAIACVLLFAFYCGARTHHRWDVLCYAFWPPLCGPILSGLFGISESWGLLSLLVLLAVLVDIDRKPVARVRADDARPLRAHP